jgi:hypothetical protein
MHNAATLANNDAGSSLRSGSILNSGVFGFSLAERFR